MRNLGFWRIVRLWIKSRSQEVKRVPALWESRVKGIVQCCAFLGLGSWVCSQKSIHNGIRVWVLEQNPPKVPTLIPKRSADPLKRTASVPSDSFRRFTKREPCAPALTGKKYGRPYSLFTRSTNRSHWQSASRKEAKAKNNSWKHSKIRHEMLQARTNQATSCAPNTTLELSAASVESRPPAFDGLRNNVPCMVINRSQCASVRTYV